MQIWKHVVRTATVIIMVSLIACATTPNLTGSWRDENYTGKFQNVLVVGISANQAARRIFEDTVVNSLKAKGVEASALFRVARRCASIDERLRPAAAAQSVGGIRAGDSGSHHRS